MKTAAILYQPEGFDTRTQRLMGRQAAGEGFLKALARHGKAEALYCYTKEKTAFEDFAQRVRPWLSSSRQVRWLPAGNPLALTEPGTLYRPDPLISTLAWQRRYTNQQAYSLCGVTHTLASNWTLDKKDCVRVNLTRTQVKLGRRAKTHPCNVKKGKLAWYRLQRVGVIVALKIG